tara:strand:- start:285 stop:479 length:195 start_codon:yes stop_codon:yes gene_type:complete
MPREDKAKHRRIDPKKDPKKRDKRPVDPPEQSPGPMGNVPTMKEGGYCRGAGAAIKGTKFEGVF